MGNIKRAFYACSLLVQLPSPNFSKFAYNGSLLDVDVYGSSVSIILEQYDISVNCCDVSHKKTPIDQQLTDLK